MILAVCTGNVCRSPLVERLLVRSLDEAGFAVPVASAGTHALVGEPMDPVTARLADDLGLSTDGHVARQLDRAMLEDARLVLTAGRSQRREVVELHPPAVRYTFTVRQLGRILERALPLQEPEARHSEPLDALIGLATRYRFGKAHSTGDDDVVDPYGRPLEVHRQALSQTLPALELLVRTLQEQRSARARTKETPKV